LAQGISRAVSVLEGRRVLIVDDSALSREVLASTCALYRMVPTAVADRETALRALESGEFDVLVLDDTMPDSLSTAALLRQLREASGLSAPRMPVVLLTSVAKARRAGSTASASGAAAAAAAIAAAGAGPLGSDNPIGAPPPPVLRQHSAIVLSVASPAITRSGSQSGTMQSRRLGARALESLRAADALGRAADAPTPPSPLAAAGALTVSEGSAPLVLTVRKPVKEKALRVALLNALMGHDTDEARSRGRPGVGGGSAMNTPNVGPSPAPLEEKVPSAAALPRLPPVVVSAGAAADPSSVGAAGAASSGPTVAASPRDSVPGAALLRILVAEDNSTNQKVAVRLLSALGANNVQVCANGEESLRMSAHSPFDLIFMDVHMPVMDGLEATRQILQRASATRPCLIAMSAATADEDKALCIAAGMDLFVAKPLKKEVLADALRFALRFIEQASRRSPPRLV
jgi:CheY-like chemotaxis protein